MSQRIYSKKQLIQYIVDFEEKYDRIPKSTEFKNDTSKPSINVFMKYFGSWNKAIMAAGFMPRNSGSNLSVEFLIQKLQEFAEALGRIPQTKDIEKSKKVPGFPTYVHYFGGIDEALKAAGLQKKNQEDISKKKNNILTTDDHCNRCYWGRRCKNNTVVVCAFRRCIKRYGFTH